MVARAYGDAQAVEQRAQVEGMDVAHVESHDSVLVVGCPVELHAIDGAETFHGVAREAAFVGGDAVHAEAIHVVERHGQRVRGHIVGGARLEFIWQAFVGRFLERDVGYHLASALIGGHAVQQVLAPVEHADACRAVHLVAAEREEVAAELAHVHAEVGHALRPVRQEERAVGVGHVGHVAHGVHRAQHVAHVGRTHQPGAGRKEAFVGVEPQGAGIVHRNDLDDDAFALTQHLPRHDVGVVLHDGEYHFVAFVEKAIAQRRSHEVEAFGRAAREDDFGRRARTDEGPHAFAGLLVQVGGLLREEVDAAVHVGVDRVVFVHHGLDDAARFLRGGGVVQVDEGAAVHLAAQDGKVGAHGVDVVGGGVSGSRHVGSCLWEVGVGRPFICRESSRCIS